MKRFLPGTAGGTVHLQCQVAHSALSCLQSSVRVFGNCVFPPSTLLGLALASSSAMAGNNPVAPLCLHQASLTRHLPLDDTGTLTAAIGTLSGKVEAGLIGAGQSHEHHGPGSSSATRLSASLGRLCSARATDLHQVSTLLTLAGALLPSVAGPSRPSSYRRFAVATRAPVDGLGVVEAASSLYGIPVRPVKTAYRPASLMSTPRGRPKTGPSASTSTLNAGEQGAPRLPTGRSESAPTQCPLAVS